MHYQSVITFIENFLENSTLCFRSVYLRTIKKFLLHPMFRYETKKSLFTKYLLRVKNNNKRKELLLPSVDNLVRKVSVYFSSQR